jgi:hypothetical protein
MSDTLDINLDLTTAEEAQHIEYRQRVTTTDAKIVSATSNLHHEVRTPLGGEA